MDQDKGDVIYYSGSDTKDNTDPNTPQISKKTLAMRRSYTQKYPIRVIRSERSDWEGAPRVGFRYDGLYAIVREDTPRNEKGGAYIRFKLERMPDQPDIDRSRPTSAEVKAFDRVKDYY
jgi:hypothetical protein